MLSIAATGAQKLTRTCLGAAAPVCHAGGVIGSGTMLATDPRGEPLSVGEAASVARLEGALLDIMYDVPSRSGIKEVVISEETITKGDAPLIVYQKETESA